MVEILKRIVKELVKNPESVEVIYKDKGKLGIFEIKVDPADVGRVIGKDGKVIKSIDNIINCINEYNKVRYVLKVKEDNKNE